MGILSLRLHGDQHDHLTLPTQTRFHEMRQLGIAEWDGSSPLSLGCKDICQARQAPIHVLRVLETLTGGTGLGKTLRPGQVHKVKGAVDFTAAKEMICTLQMDCKDLV